MTMMPIRYVSKGEKSELSDVFSEPKGESFEPKGETLELKGEVFEH